MRLSASRSFLLTALLLPASSALALGLGEIRVLSNLGERLHAEIDVQVEAHERFDPACVSVQKPAGLDGVPWVQRADLSLRKSAGTKLVIRSAATINEPVMQLGLAVGCGAELQRDYALLLAPAASRLVERVSSPAAPPRRVEAHDAVRAPVANAVKTASAPAHTADQNRAERPSRPLRKAKELAPSVLAMSDRVVLSAGLSSDVGEPFLRLASELRSWRADGDSGPGEAYRELLRLEYRVLRTLYEQGQAQLDTAEKLRQMETQLGELQQRSGDVTRRLDPGASEASAPVSVPAAGAPVPAASEPPAATVASAPTSSEPPANAATPPTAPTESAVNTGGAAATAPGKPPVSGSGAGKVLIILSAAIVVLALLAWLVVRLTNSRRPLARSVTPSTVAAPVEPVLDDFDDEPYVRPSAARPAAAGDSVPVLNSTVSLAPDPKVAEPPLPATPSLSQTSVAAATVDEHYEVNPVMELADIMLSFGRVKGAAQALQEFIDNNPQEALQPWIRLMDVYRMAGMRSEFERVAAELNQHFNVEIQNWDGTNTPHPEDDEPTGPVEPLPIQWPKGLRKAKGIEELDHIVANLTQTWPSLECGQYLDKLLRDNRGGLRTGFSIEVVDEIMFLIDLRATVAAMGEPNPVAARA